ncbi:mandelate racemase/muconate lactonizing enzyme family protein [Pseudomonas sp. L1(2025)]|uniref:mandelate racemase/muconate lactonizing enzyme family protein n=1 Tax=Pseudomonas sp. L1(2025) TaxID=3449429 RepID=UPI003F68E1A6
MIRIKRIKLGVLRIPLRKPFVSALRYVDSIEDVVVQIETDCGLRGYGVATPALRVNGESVDSIISVVRDLFAPRLIGNDISGFETILNAIDHCVVGHSAAKASIDVALHDLISQAAGFPLYRFLGGNSKQITTGISISNNALDEMVNDACAAVSDGFTTLKLKLGSDQGIDTDIRLVQQIRGLVGGQVEIGVDANQAWSEKDALKFVLRMETIGANLSFIEQPVLSSELSSLARVAAAWRIPVLADESCSSPHAAVDLINDGLIDGVAIKLMKLGGIRAARVVYDVARLRSKICAVTCLMESPIGVAASASFCSGRNVRFIDLDPMALIAHNPVIGGVTMLANKLVLSDVPGLGIEGIEEVEPVVTIK